MGIKEAPGRNDGYTKQIIRPGDIAVSNGPQAQFALVDHVLSGAMEPVISPDGIHKTYHWADILEIDRSRLEAQKLGHWGRTYKAWHEDFAAANPHPKHLLVVGVPENADQISFLANKYPEAEILGIEINPANTEGAINTLKRENPGDVESGRVKVITGDALEMLPSLKGFGYAEADKVAIHLLPDDKARLYKGMGGVLVPGGVFHISCIMAETWNASAAPGLEYDPEAQLAAENTRELMKVILNASWPARGIPLWKDLAEKTGEIKTHVPNLEILPDFTRSDHASPTSADTYESAVSQLIAITPYAQALAAVKRGAPIPSERLDQLFNAGKSLVEAIRNPKVVTILPDNSHVAGRIAA